MKTKERFMSFVELQDSHWVWKGANFTLEWNSIFKKSLVVRPRHAAAVLFLGATGKFAVREICGNSKCVNPDHLVVGEKNKLDVSPRAKLASGDVIHIKELIAAGKDIIDIAKMYNVDRTTIYQIKAGRNWKDD